MAERRLRAFRRTIFLDQVEPRQRHVEPRALGVLQQHELRVAVALIDFLQSLILPDAVLHVDDVVADLQIAEVRKKRRHLRLLPLRPRSHRVRLVEQIPRTEDRKMRVRKHHAIRHVSLGQRGRQHLAGKVTGLVGVALAAARAASQPERHVVFGKDVGQSLDLAGVRHREQHLIALARKLLHFFEHRRNRAMEARSRAASEMLPTNPRLRCA